MQRILRPDQLEAFYHSEFVRDQVKDFLVLLEKSGLRLSNDEMLVDIGGGVGYFASSLAAESGLRVKVLEMDQLSIEQCRTNGISADLGDATSYSPRALEKVACMNLLLHHLIGASARSTLELQSKAISNWHGANKFVFVNEYIYESYVPGFSSWLIYQITSSKILSFIAKLISLLIPAFKANTFGVGVRFRSDAGWKEIFRKLNFKVVGETVGEEEKVATPLRLLLIKSIKRNSYLITSAS